MILSNDIKSCSVVYPWSGVQINEITPSSIVLLYYKIVIIYVKCLFHSWESLGEGNSSHRKDIRTFADLNEGLK